MRLNYVLAVLVVFQCCGAQAYSDIPSLLTGLSTLAPPMVPSSLNMALRSLVKDVATFVKYPANLQRAMLWNAGWVRIIPESAGSGSASDGVGEYVQMYVQCGLTMSSIFLSESTLSDGSLCELKTCKEGIITYTRSTCERSYVESKTLCALSPEADSFDATLSQRNGPMWSTNGDLDESFDPQFYQFNNGTGDNPSIYMLAQQSSWIMSDDSCSNRAQFIVPCRKVGDDEIADTWCVPPIESWVLDWVDNETQSIDPSAVTTIQDSSEGNGGLKLIDFVEHEEELSVEEDVVLRLVLEEPDEFHGDKREADRVGGIDNEKHSDNGESGLKSVGDWGEVVEVVAAATES
ncbi:hypothetical protein PRIC2_004860 [Phytophthora ramorum]